MTLLFLSNDGDDLVYDYKVVGGKMPESGGLTALFIEKFGPGGGAGAGFHGVGARGPGAAGLAGRAVVNDCSADGSC